VCAVDFPQTLFFHPLFFFHPEVVTSPSGSQFASLPCVPGPFQFSKRPLGQTLDLSRPFSPKTSSPSLLPPVLSDLSLCFNSFLPKGPIPFYVVLSFGPLYGSFPLTASCVPTTQSMSGPPFSLHESCNLRLPFFKPFGAAALLIASFGFPSYLFPRHLYPAKEVVMSITALTLCARTPQNIELLFWGPCLFSLRFFPFPFQESPLCRFQR